MTLTRTRPDNRDTDKSTHDALKKNLSHLFKIPMGINRPCPEGGSRHARRRCVSRIRRHLMQPRLRSANTAKNTYSACMHTRKDSAVGHNGRAVGWRRAVFRQIPRAEDCRVNGPITGAVSRDFGRRTGPRAIGTGRVRSVRRHHLLTPNETTIGGNEWFNGPERPRRCAGGGCCVPHIACWDKSPVGVLVLRDGDCVPLYSVLRWKATDGLKTTQLENGASRSADG